MPSWASRWARSVAAIFAFELRQVERLRAQPLDHVLLGQPVLALVVERDRHDDLALGRQLRQHLALQPPHEAAPPQVPVQALLGAAPLEPAGEARAGAEVLEAPDARAAGDQLLGVVEDRRAGQREAQAVGGIVPASRRTACVRLARGFLQ